MIDSSTEQSPLYLTGKDDAKDKPFEGLGVYKILYNGEQKDREIRWGLSGKADNLTG